MKNNIGYIVSSFFIIMIVIVFLIGLNVIKLPKKTIEPNSVINVEETKIKLNNTNITIEVGETIELVSTITSSDTTVINKVWESNNSNVATVDNGIVTGKKVGETIITVKLDTGESATCTVNVIEKNKINNDKNNNKTNNPTSPQVIEVQNITLNYSSTSLYLNDKLTIIATISPTNASNKNITWESSNSNIATVMDGIVTAKSVGKAIITAKTSNGKTGTCEINVVNKKIEVTGISLNKTSANLYKGDKLILTTTIIPSNATDKNITWTSSNKKVATIANGNVTTIGVGETTITAKTSNGKTASCKITVKEHALNAEVYFINVHNKPTILSTLVNDETYPNGYGVGLSVIIKTPDSKYILIDTGKKNKAVKDIVYKELKKVQNNSKVKLDYMIITHGHDDHDGNAAELLKDNNISVSNVIMKKESKNMKHYNNVANSLPKTTKMINPKSEGQKITLGKFLEIYLFNTADVYKNKTCHSKGVTYRYSSKEFTKLDGKYYYFDGSTYPNIKIVSTDTYVKKHKTDTKGLDNYFYLYKSESVDDCNENANSLAILIKVKTNNGDRYMYFPGDIDNSGYDLTPINGIYGNGRQIVFASGAKVSFSKNSNAGLISGYISNLNKFTSETTAAKNIKNLLGKNIKNITIYQSSHHGDNNAPDAMKILDLNRDSLYMVIPNRIDIGKLVDFDYLRTYYYTLSKTQKLYPGGKEKNGVYCSINDIGKTICRNY